MLLRRALAGVVFLLSATSAHGQLTLDQVARSGAITGSVPAALAWAPDGRRLAFTWDSAGGSGLRLVWLVGADGRGRRPLAGTAGTRELAWLPSGTTLLVLRGGDLVRLEASPTAASPGGRTVASGLEDAHDLSVSPDGRQAAWLAGGDLHLLRLDSAGAAPRRLTALGLPSVSTTLRGTYARLDREIGPATWASGAPSYAWHPDGRTLAVHVVDRTAVRLVPFPSYLGDETTPNLERRSYPGDPNESRTLAFVDVASGAMTPLAFDAPTAVQVLGFGWSSRGDLLVDRETDDATARWVHVVRPGSAPRLVYHDARPTRIYTEHASVWTASGDAVLLTTDREDRYRVFRVAVGGDTTPQALTPAEADVQGAAMPLPDGGLAWLSSAPSPAERHLWRRAVGLATPVTQVTRRPGVHRVVMAPDGRTAASLVSDDVTPPHLVLVSMSGSPEVTVTPPGGPALAAAGLVAPRYVRFPGAEPGDTLHAKVWLPAAAIAGRRVPVVFGPVYSNTVRNRWGGTYGLLQQLLVQRGYALIQVDVRGSTGYGRAFREKFLFAWGGRDLDDLAAAKGWLGGQPWADTSRTGIFGSSYGGLVTVWALLTRPGMFRAGVAGAAAVEPRFFGSDDVAIARRPATHPEVFARSARARAGGLADPLLLIHGLLDDVVPFKTIADLAEALMQAGRPFDLAVAPGATHGWTGQPHHARHLLGKLVEHFERHLPPTPR